MKSVKALFDGLLPARCLLCDALAGSTANICDPCHLRLPWLEHSCRLCALPLAAPGLCGGCQRRAPPFTGAIACFEYGQPVRHLLINFKFHRQLAPASLLGAVLAQRVAADCKTLPDAIIPVPLHPARIRQRGFNQSLEIARHLSTRLGIALRSDQVQRVKNTLPQTGLHTAAARRRNLARAFQANRPQTGHVAIVDDVYTTGATASALARCLGKAGAARVDLWVVARAP